MLFRLSSSLFYGISLWKTCWHFNVFSTNQSHIYFSFHKYLSLSKYAYLAMFVVYKHGLIKLLCYNFNTNIALVTSKIQWLDLVIGRVISSEIVLLSKVHTISISLTHLSNYYIKVFNSIVVLFGNETNTIFRIFLVFCYQ